MSPAATAFPTAAMDDFAADAGGWASELRAEAADLSTALDAFRSSGSEFMPSVPAHGGRIEALGDQTAALGDSVGALAAAAEEADRRGVADFARIVQAVAAGVKLADVATSTPQAVTRLLRLSVHATRAARGKLGDAAIRARYGPRPMPDIARIRARIPGGATMPRSQVRRLQLQQYRENKGTRRASSRRVSAGRAGMRTNAPLTRVGRGVSTFMRSPTGRVIRTGGRVLGGAASVVSFADAGFAIAEGDTERAVTSGLSGVGGALMLTPNPVTAGIGATIVVGTLVYEHREAIGDALGDAAGAVKDGAKKLFDGIF